MGGGVGLILNPVGREVFEEREFGLTLEGL